MGWVRGCASTDAGMERRDNVDMSNTDKQESGGFAVSVIFILSILVLILMFILFTRDQGNKAVEKTLVDLATSNQELQESHQELQESQKQEKEKSLRERMEEAGIDPDRLWTIGDTCEIPYCLFTSLGLDGADAARVVGLERWSGYFGRYEDVERTCDAFIADETRAFPIRLDHLAKIEQDILTASAKTDPIDITVFRVAPEASGVPPCDRAAFVMNVHLD